MRLAAEGAKPCRAMVMAVVLVLASAVPAAALPDSRGYELVSPADKNGGDVMPNTPHTRAASDGGAVAFDSLTGFADVHGVTLASEYMAVRTGLAGTQGWVTHGITPVQAPLTLAQAFFAQDPAYEGEMSPDLRHGVYRSARPLTDAPNVAGMANLYVRDDLRTPGPGSYQLISDSLTPQATDFAQKPFLASASANFSHVLFESRLALVPGATGGATNLYEWADGMLRLAGVLPDGTAAPSSQAGVGAAQHAYTPHMISADGSRVFFQAPADPDLSAPSGNVYMRIDGTTTVQLNASEKTAPESPQGASLWTASTDGSRVFFISGEGLVNGDDNGQADLYMYDVNAPAGHHLTLVSTDENNSEPHAVLDVVGTSTDGHYVYFIAAGQLVAGEPQIGPLPGLYLWHDGAVTFIGDFAIPGDASFNTLNTSWNGLVRSMDTGRVSADGTSVLFMTRSDAGFRGRFGFSGYNHGRSCTFDNVGGGPCRELYVYNDTLRRLQCASCIPGGGATAAGDAMTAVIERSSNTPDTSHVSHALSDDGHYVFFSTREALVPEDVNGKWDAYEFDVLTGQMHLLSSGRSTDDSYFLDASSSGNDAFFVTRQQLVGWDTDDSYDLYDARVGGGMPDPVSTPVCTGEGCQGQPGVAPAAGATASDLYTGAGDASGRLRARVVRTRTVHCKRGTHRKRIKGRIRCVRTRPTRRARAAQR